MMNYDKITIIVFILEFILGFFGAFMSFIFPIMALGGCIFIWWVHWYSVNYIVKQEGDN